MNIVDKQISNKIITFNDKDAPWITPKVKTAIKRNSRVYRQWVKLGRKTNDFDNVREVRNSANKFIKEAKLAYYTNLGIKLSDPETGQKHFWTAYKRIANKMRNTNIPPIIDNDIFISNFKKKADLFNDYFAIQCIINNNGSVLPSLVPETAALLSHVSVTKEQIINIINDLSSNKAHGYDGMSASMLKLCAAEVASPLQIIFQDCRKYANVQHIHTKNSRQIISNYRPISLLPICSKILEKIVFDQVYAFLNTNNLLSVNQCGFRPSDSTIYQLLSTSTIYDSFENYDETRAIFLDISKAFDKVWHYGIILKLKCNGISGNLLNFFENYLQNRFQRMVLNGKESNWKGLKAVLGPLLFLVYINDLTDNISSEMRLFADDASLFVCVKGVSQTHDKLVKDLLTVTQ